METYSLKTPELENKLSLVLETITNPDELYIDPTGVFHALKRLHSEVSDYIVVIYHKEEGEGYIRTLLYKF